MTEKILFLLQKKTKKEENEANKKINQKRIIKINEKSSISSNIKNKIKLSDKNIFRFNVKDNKEKENVIDIKKEEDKNQKLIREKESNYIQKKYNLAEAYRKNHILEKVHKNSGTMTYKGIKFFKIYDLINDGCNQIKNNKNFRNLNLNNKYFDDVNNTLSNYNDEQVEEDDYKNYTAAYRDKMVYKLKEKLNRDNIVNTNIIDDSLSELKTEKQSISFLDMHSIQKDGQENKAIKNPKKNLKSYINSDNNIFKKNFKPQKTYNKFLKTIKSKRKEDYIKEIEKNKTDIGMYNSQINKLCGNKNKEIKKIAGLIKKDDFNIKKAKNILLIKDLIKNFNKSKKFSYMTFNNSKRLNSNNNNANKNITFVKSSRTQSTSFNKNENVSNKKKENKNYILNKKKNSNFNKENFKLQSKIIKINKKRSIQHINKENKIYTQRVSGDLKKRECIIQKNNQKDLVLKLKGNVSLKNIINNNKKKINIFTEYLDRKKESKKNHRVMFVHNIINQMKLYENQAWFNRTMEKENKIIPSSNIRKKKKKRCLLSITSSSNKKVFNLNIKSPNNNKIKNIKELDLRNNKNKKKIELQVLTPSISSTIIKENKLSSGIKKNSKKNNYSNDTNMTTILNKYANDSINKKKI